MISGPTIPNTLCSLRELLVQRMDLLEHGLRAICTDIVLGADAGVDVLACDATGAPVLVFLCVGDNAAQIPTRVLGALSWLRQNAAFLGRETGDPCLRSDLEPRAVVIGLDVPSDTLETLRRARIARLSVLQLCSFTIGGRLRIGLTPLFEAEGGRANVAGDSFLVPSGIADAGQRAVAAHFLDLARRIDPDVVATGDRFSRHLQFRGRCLARMGLAAGQLLVEFPAASEPDDEVLALTRESCEGAVDRLLRRVLVDATSADGSEAGRCDGREAALPHIAEPLAAVMRTMSSPPTGDQSDAGPEREGDRFSLEPIRRSVARSQLSREEFSALGDEGSDS